MRRTLTIAFVLLGLLIAAVPMPALADDVPTIVVTPYQNLDDSGPVQVLVDGSGYPPEETVIVMQCRTKNTTEISCDVLLYGMSSTAGTFSLQAPVAYDQGPGLTCDWSPTEKCEVVVWGIGAGSDFVDRHDIYFFGHGSPPEPPPPSPYTITTTADSGAGSLREAINAANADPDTNTITFGFTGTGPFVIQPQTPLPDVTQPVIIDGTSAPGFVDCATGPEVEIDGSLAGAAHGLALSSASTVRGLAINRFTTSGRAGIFVNNANARVECNFLGTDTTGTIDLGNYIGVLLSGSATIGGSGSAGNLISGNTVGIYVTASGANGQILGNRIGTDRTGTVDLGNSFEGILVDGAFGLRIGSSTAGEGNLISGNNSFGIRMRGGGITVQGNRIGVAATGFSALGNTSDGVNIPNIGSNDNNTVGGTAAGQGNVIAFNGGAGVFVQDRVNNRILGNSIDSNGSLGINLGSGPLTLNDVDDVDTGPNNYQNFPEISQAESNGLNTAVGGSLDSNTSASGITYRLEFFASPACDSLGHGEGRVFLGSQDVTTSPAGHAAFVAYLDPSTAGHFLTATATDPNGDTSEFSACHPIAAVPPPPDDCELSLSNSLAEIAPPTSVAPDAYESNTQLSIFREQQGVRISGSRAVDILDPGCYTDVSFTGGSIPNNTVVDSYLIHGDNLGSGVVTLEGTWTFDSDVLGLIVSEQLLDLSDVVHGWPYTTYPAAATDSGRGTTIIGGDAAGEWVELDADRRTLRLRMQFDAHLDQVRVLTAGTERPDITVDDVTVTEGDSGTSNATLTVSLSQSYADPVKVSYRTRDFTATSPDDFTALGGNPLPTLTFAPGETNKTVSISVVGDTLDEPNEVIEFELSRAGNATITKPFGTVTITDDDEEAPPPPDDCEMNPLDDAIVVIDPPGNVRQNQKESDTELFFFAEQHGHPLAADLPVDIAGPGCYTTTGTAGALIAQNTVVDSYLIHGDDDLAGVVRLDGIYVFPTQILGVIVTEGTPSAAGLDGTDAFLGWPYTFYPSTPLPDFDSNRGTTPHGGDSGGDWIEIDPDGRTLRLHMEFDAYLDQVRVITAGTFAPTMSIDDVIVAETDSGTTDAVFTVSLSAPSLYTVKVTYTTHDGTADSPDDFAAATGVLTFAPGETQKTVSVSVNGDLIDESDESYTVDLTKAGNASIADGSGLGTITDDDGTPPPECDIGQDALVVIEPPESVAAGVFTSDTELRLFGEQHGYALPADLAVDIVDPGCYVATGDPGTILEGTVVDSHLIHGDNPAPGTEVSLYGTWEFEADILGVMVIDANLDTSDDLFASPAIYALGWPYTGYPTGFAQRGMTGLMGETGDWIEIDPDRRTLRLRMRFDEALDQVRVVTASTPAPTLSIDDVSVAETDSGTTAAVFTVSLSAPSLYTVMVTYGTADVSATAPADYGQVAGVLTFAPGETSKTVTVAVKGDTVDEADETYTVELSLAGNATIVDGSGLGTITDDDEAGRIVVNKHTDPDASAQEFQFQLNGPSSGVAFSLQDGDSFESVPLPAGHYSVSEDPEEGWDPIAATCSSSFGGDPFAPSSIDLEDSEVVTCDFYNGQLGKIIVVKTTDPAGSAQAFAFTASYDADGFSLRDGESNDSGWLEPGIYSVGETVPGFWELTDASCDDGSPVEAVDLAPGEVVRCDFHNAYSPPPADIQVSKVVSTTTPLFGNTFLYTITVTNAGASPAQSVVLTDDLSEDLDIALALPAGCAESTGQLVTCSLGTLAPAETRVISLAVRAVFDCTVAGDSGSDRLVGTAAADRICGGGGADTIDARGGNDEILGCGVAGSITNRAAATTTSSDSNPANNLSAVISVNVSAGVDGKDTIDGESGSDTIIGCDGNDVINGGTGADTLHGGAGDDKADGDAGNDTVNGDSGDDKLWGDEGADTIDGGTGDDKIYGNEGGDSLDGGSGDDEIFGNEGEDTIDGGIGHDDLNGGDDNDILVGREGNDDLFGSFGVDTLFGNEGNDNLDGGNKQGGNTLNGGPGTDSCSFGPKGSPDIRIMCETS